MSQVRRLLFSVCAVLFALASLLCAPASAQTINDVDTLALPKPEVVLSPAPPIAQVTHLPTWLAVRHWESFDTVYGRAEPVAVTYDMGNGDTVTCNGQGQFWKYELGELQETDCSYTYIRSSARAPDAIFVIKAFVHYRVGGRIIYSPTAEVPVAVSEIQSLVVAPDSDKGNTAWDQSNSPEVTNNGNRHGILGGILDFGEELLKGFVEAGKVSALVVGHFFKGIGLGTWDLLKGLVGGAVDIVKLSPQRILFDGDGWWADVKELLDVAQYIWG